MWSSHTRVLPKLVAKEDIAEPITAFCEVSENLIVTGSVHGRLSVWDWTKSEIGEEAERIAQLAGVSTEAVESIATHDGELHCTFGSSYVRTWKLSDVLKENRACSQYNFRRNLNDTIRFKTQTLHRSQHVLLMTEGQAWSHLIDVAKKSDSKPSLASPKTAVPCDMIVAKSPEQGDTEETDGIEQKDSILMATAQLLLPAPKFSFCTACCCVGCARYELKSTVKVWDVATARSLLELLVPCNGGVRFFGSDRVVCCNGRQVDMYDIPTKKLLSSYGGHSRDIRSFDVQEPETCATFCDGLVLKVWKGAQCTNEIHLSGLISNCYGPDWTELRLMQNGHALLKTGNCLYMISVGEYRATV